MNAVLVIMIITIVVVKGMADTYETTEVKAEKEKREVERKMEAVLNKYKRQVGPYLAQMWLDDMKKYTEYEAEERNKYRWRRAQRRADEYIERFETQGIVPDYIPAYIVDATPIYYEPKTSFAKNLGRVSYEML